MIFRVVFNRLIVSALGILLPSCFLNFEVCAEPTRDEIAAAMRRAATYFRGSVARHGGYVYYYSPDLSRRLGEGVASTDQIWVQPPGTPTVGMTYLTAYRATKDPFYLEAAKDTAEPLLYGQLESGGWTNAIDFDPQGSQTGRYRDGKGKPGGRNFSSLDDGITQGALRFLMHLDEETGLENRRIHKAATFALDALLRSQFPNGAFPQGWDEKLAQPKTAVGLRATYPEYDWRTKGRIKEYWDRFNLNDDISLTVAEALIDGHKIYGRSDCLTGLKKLGDFLIRAQMPDPQPAWAQQYSYEMHPIWARKFEPPAIAGRESEGVIAALLTIASHLRDGRYLEPVPRALEYLEKSELPGGQLARFYELKSNRPLYMERRGQGYLLTHDDSRLPSHYGWKTKSRVAELRRAYHLVMERKSLLDPIFSPQAPDPSVSEILATLDDQGRWISTYAGEAFVGNPKFRKGERFISSAVFCRNLEILSVSLQ